MAIESHWLNDIQKKNKYIESQAYKNIVWVYSCVNMIANSISGCPINMYRGTTKLDETLFTPLDPTISTTTELIKRIFIYLETAGGCFLLLNRKRNELTGVTLIGPQYIRPILTKDNTTLLGWARYDLKTRKRLNVYSIKELIPLLYFDPDNPYQGLSPLTAAKFAAEQYFSMMRWNAAYFKDGIRSDLIVKYKKRLKDDQRIDARRAIEQYTKGTQGGHGVLLLDGTDYDVEKGPGAVSIKDLDFIEGNQLTREDICSVFGVPPAMVGIFRYANYANTSEQRKIFWEHCAQPRMEYIKNIISSLYLDIWKPGTTMEWDLSGVSVLQVTQKEKSTISLIYRKAGKTWDEIAEILNAPELAGETVDEEEGGETDIAQDMPSEARSHGSKATEAEDDIYQTYGLAVRSLLAPIERSWSALVQSMIKQIGAIMLRKVEAGDPPQVMAGVWLDTWYQLAYPLVKRAMELGLLTVEQEIGAKGITPDVCRKFVGFSKISTPIGTLLDVDEREAFERGVQAYTKTTVDVSASVIDKMNQGAMKIYRDGGGIRHIQQQLRNLVTETYKGRHLTIARTVNGGAYNGARAVGMRKIGASKTRWITSGNKTVRKEHRRINGEEVLFGEKFSNGLRWPHDPYGSAREVINCVCTTAITAIKQPGRYRPKNVPASSVVPVIDSGALKAQNAVYDFKGFSKEFGEIRQINTAEARSLLYSNAEQKILSAAAKKIDGMGEWRQIADMTRKKAKARVKKYKIFKSFENAEVIENAQGHMIKKALREYIPMTKKGQRAMSEYLAGQWSDEIFEEAFKHTKLKFLVPANSSMTRAFSAAPWNSICLSKRDSNLLFSYFDAIGSDSLSAHIASLHKIQIIELQDALSVLSHEVGHFVQNNSPKASTWAWNFWKERVKGESIANIAQAGTYGAYERGVVDKFYHTYQGRVYGAAGYQEVVSMFVERAALSPQHLEPFLDAVIAAKKIGLGRPKAYHALLGDNDGWEKFMTDLMYKGD